MDLEGLQASVARRHEAIQDAQTEIRWLEQYTFDIASEGGDVRVLMNMNKKIIQESERLIAAYEKFLAQKGMGGLSPIPDKP